MVRELPFIPVKKFDKEIISFISGELKSPQLPAVFSIAMKTVRLQDWPHMLLKKNWFYAKVKNGAQ